MRFRMLTMTPKKIAEICGGTYYGDRNLATKEITGVVTDNRQVTEGGMFVAIKGAKVDGNRFVPAAYESWMETVSFRLPMKAGHFAACQKMSLVSRKRLIFRSKTACRRSKIWQRITGQYVPCL